MTDQIVDSDNTLREPYLLCRKCQEFVSSSLILNSKPGLPSGTTLEVFEHHTSVTDLLEAVEAGCHLCTLAEVELLRQHGIFTYQERPKLPDSTKEVSVLVRSTGINDETRYGPPPYGYAKLHFTLREPNEVAPPDLSQISHTCLDLFRGMPDINMACCGLSPNAPMTLTLVDAARLSLSTGSDTCLDFASTCLQWCLKSHQKCSSKSDEGSLGPSRVIDIGSPDSPDTARVCLLAELPSKTKYLTLSHCWGKYDVPTLRTANIVLLRKQLKWNSLPPTFKEALKVTHRLGFRYIWIDSLCIIQDDPSDWQREGLNMSHIYRNSTCTIAALFARDASEGLFCYRNPLQHVPCRLGNANADGFSTFCSPTGIPLVPCGIPFLSQNPEHARLLTRAWVIQERAICRRTIYFGHDQLHWECLQCDISDQVPYAQVDTSYPRLKRAFYSLLDPEASEFHNEPYFVQTWITLVDEYTKSDLTYQKDRLIAFEGILRLITERRKTAQTAGLLRECLLHDLIWYVRSPARRVGNGAPSWSWASITGPIWHRQREPGAGRDSKTKPILWRAEVIHVDDRLELEQVSEEMIRYAQPCVVAIQGPVVQHGVDGKCYALLSTLAADDRFRLTSPTGGYYSYELKLDAPATEPQDELFYLEMAFNAKGNPGTTPCEWYYLVIVPNDRNHKQFKRSGFLIVRSSSQERPPVVWEEHRITELV